MPKAFKEFLQAQHNIVASATGNSLEAKLTRALNSVTEDKPISIKLTTADQIDRTLNWADTNPLLENHQHWMTAMRVTYHVYDYKYAVGLLTVFIVVPRLLNASNPAFVDFEYS